MILFLTAVAPAATYTAELAVPSIHPSWYAPAKEAGAHRILAETTGPDITVASTHPAVTCRVEDGRVIAEMKANKANYPTSFPFNATCSYGSDTLKLTVVKWDPSTDPSLQTPVLDASSTFTQTKVAGTMTVQALLLPACSSGTSYKARTRKAVGLKGVFCKVLEAGPTPKVQIMTAATSTTGVGTCTLPLTNGQSYQLHVDLSEGPI